MRSIVFSFFILLNLYNYSIYGQLSGKLTYSIVKNDVRFGKRELQSIVYINGNSSVEFPISKTLAEMKLKADENHDYVVIKDAKSPFIYKNFSKKTLFCNGQIGLRQSVLITDTLENFKWSITKEKTKFLNYNCRKATTYFRGRKYIAWYAEDIAISNGPWKFCGLPGLIVSVSDDENHFSYKLTSIDLKSKFDDRIIAIPKTYGRDKPISFKAYTILSNKKNSDYKKLSKVVTTNKDGSYGTVAITHAEEMEKF